MPRKTRFEIRAESEAPEPGTEAFWRLRRTEASARRQMLEVKHRQLLIDKMTGDLIPRSEVREMFQRVFSAYRGAIREIDRRYGPEAASILMQAERSALRTDQEENKCQTSGEASQAKPVPPAKSPPLRRKKS